MKRTLVVNVIAALLILLFVYAGISKLQDYDTFKFQIGRSPYVTSMAGFVAWALPVGELIVALLLIVKNTRLWGLYASFFLVLLFTGYIYAMLYYSYYVPCSCGGVLSQMSWEQHLVFNLVFVLLALTGILIYRKEVDNREKTNVERTVWTG